MASASIRLDETLVEKAGIMAKAFNRTVPKQIEHWAKIGDSRFARIEKGNFGDWSATSETDVYKLRFFFGSGYRVYYTIRDNKVVLLLNGGDKSTQNKDIQRAKQILDAL